MQNFKNISALVFEIFTVEIAKIMAFFIKYIIGNFWGLRSSNIMLTQGCKFISKLPITCTVHMIFFRAVLQLILKTKGSKNEEKGHFGSRPITDFTHDEHKTACILRTNKDTGMILISVDSADSQLSK